jgi:hypothetical protein
MNTEDRKRLMTMSESELRAALIEAQEDAEINLKAAERNFDALKRVEAENARLIEALKAICELRTAADCEDVARSALSAPEEKP